MEENNINNTTAPVGKNGKGLGIAGLILGIVATIFSFVPCLGCMQLSLAL